MEIQDCCPTVIYICKCNIEQNIIDVFLSSFEHTKSPEERAHFKWRERSPRSSL